MSMVFCRGCGKEIHTTAPACPYCGAPQSPHIAPGPKPAWTSIVSIIIGGLGFLGSVDVTPYDRDEFLGIALFCGLSIVLAGITLYERKPGRNLSVIAITLAVIGLLACFGSLS